MRGLALARLHYLTKTRTAPAALIIALALAVFPIAVNDVLWFNSSDQWELAVPMQQERAKNPVIAYLFHVIVLVITCDLFGKPRAVVDGVRLADLTETAPIKPASRFLGDAVGIFRSAGVIHLCTLPLLALSVALSPLTATLFFWLEALVLAVMILASAGAAWKFRSTGKWVRTQTARSIALFAIFFVIILMATTRWQTFRDAAFSLLVQPSPLVWREVSSAIVSAPLMLGLILTLYLAYLVFYFISSIRNQEKLHAL